MNSKYQIIAGMVLWLSCSMAAAVPVIQHWQTSNGVDVYFVATDGLPIVDARLVFNAGSAYDGKDYGLAALTSSLLDQGAAGENAQQIAEQLESVGAQLSTGSSRDFSSISFRSLSDPAALNAAWAVFKNILNAADFPAQDFEREKQRSLLSIKRRQESPGVLAQLALYQEIYKEHPYANPIQGDALSVSNIGLDELKGFYQQYYVASNAKLVLVAGVSRQQAEDMAENLLADLPVGHKARPIAEVGEITQGKAIHVEYPSQQTHIMYSLPVMIHNDADNFALYLGNHILGGSGFSSRIVKEIREERGLAYSAYSYFHPMVQKGPFLIGLQTRNEKRDEAVAAVKQTLAEFIEDGPTKQELIAAKKNISGSFALRLDSNKKLLASVVNIVASDAPLDYLNTYLQNIEAVSVEQIREAFQRRLIVDKMVMVTAGQATGEKQ